MRWVQIYGYRWLYRISEEGEVQRMLDTGKWRTLKPHFTKYMNRATIRMQTPEGRKTEVALVNLMANAFMGGRKPGYDIIHKDGCKTKCELWNLQFVPSGHAGDRTRDCRRRAVVKLDRDGNHVALYRSIEAAADANFISRTSVLNRCHNKIKDPYKLDGHNYQFDREE